MLENLYVAKADLDPGKLSQCEPQSLFYLFLAGLIVLCLCRPFIIFEECLESGLLTQRSCRDKQTRYQLSHPYVKNTESNHVFFCRIIKGGHGHSHGAPAVTKPKGKKDKKDSDTEEDKTAKQKEEKKKDKDEKGEKETAGGDTEKRKEGEKAVAKAVEKKGEEEEEIKVAGYLNLAADCFHNFTDGLAIGASFLAGESIGKNILLMFTVYIFLVTFVFERCGLEPVFRIRIHLIRIRIRIQYFRLNANPDPGFL